VAANFVPKLAASPLGATHAVCSPAKLDGQRDQNSVVLLKKTAFDCAGASEVCTTPHAACEPG